MMNLVQDIIAYGVSAIIPIGCLIFIKNIVTRSDYYSEWAKKIICAVYKPLFAIIVLYSTHLFFIYSESMSRLDRTPWINKILLVDDIVYLLLIGSLFWVLSMATQILLEFLNKLASEKNSKINIFLLSISKKNLNIIMLIILANWLLPILIPPAMYQAVFSKGMKVALIASLSWILVQIISASEQIITLRYGADSLEDFKSRKIYTQFEIVKRMVLSIIFILTFILILMTFENFRVVGETLLASAGLIAGITTFAAQKTLSNIFAGLSIAIAQPIRINDAVMIEEEFGKIQEITLTHVVIKLWDLRTLVLPINYFIEKPFQNWTKDSKELIGTVYLNFDYTFPIEELRNQVQDKIEQSPLWDKNLLKIEVTELKKTNIELRLLISARTPDDLWNLRCAIREDIVALINANYINYLPKYRVLS